MVETRTDTAVETARNTIANRKGTMKMTDIAGGMIVEMTETDMEVGTEIIVINIGMIVAGIIEQRGLRAGNDAAAPLGSLTFEVSDPVVVRGR